jgi:adenylate cyclase
MAVFGAPRMTPDHALDAARAALRIQSTSQESSVGQPDWPRFRIGVNTGEALVGNIGSDQFRNFTVIGDTVNTAQRLQAIAEPGQVVVGSVTAAALGDTAVVDWLGDVAVKGKREPLRPGILRSLPPSTPTVG